MRADLRQAVSDLGCIQLTTAPGAGRGRAGLPFCLRQVAIAQSPKVEMQEYHQDDPLAVSRNGPPEAASPFFLLQWIELIAGLFFARSRFEPCAGVT
jgi:hypothetical protein